MEQNNKPENPYIFPNTDPNYFGAKDSFGMDLRDHYAGLAMQGILSGALVNNIDDYFKAADKRKMDISQYIAMNAYEMADAMLTERQKDK